MSYYVYIHTCPNGKRYIGQHTGKDPKDRWRYNGRGYIRQVFYRAIKKYGWNNIEHIIYECDTKTEMNYLERYLISYYQSNNPKYGYNMSEGGESGTSGYKHTEESHRKMLEWRKTFIQPPLSKETKQKMKDIARKNRGKKVYINDILFNSYREADEYFGWKPRTTSNGLKNGHYKGYKITKV